MAKSSIQEIPAGFYVYKIVVDGIVRYIGKGSGSRAWEHLRLCRKIMRERSEGAKVRTTRFYNRLIFAIQSDVPIRVDIANASMTEADALSVEAEQIAAAPVGQLWNTLPGGIGFTSEFIKSLWDDPEYRAANGRRSASLWQEPAFRANQIAKRNAPSQRQHMSEVLTDALAAPAVKAKMRAAKKEGWRSPEYRKRRQDSLRKTWADPDVIAKQSASQRKRFEDISQRRAASERASIRMSDPEQRKTISDRLKALWSDPEYREMQMRVRGKCR